MSEPAQPIDRLRFDRFVFAWRDRGSPVDALAAVRLSAQFGFAMPEDLAAWLAGGLGDYLEGGGRTSLDTAFGVAGKGRGAANAWANHRRERRVRTRLQHMRLLIEAFDLSVLEAVDVVTTTHGRIGEESRRGFTPPAAPTATFLRDEYSVRLKAGTLPGTAGRSRDVDYLRWIVGHTDLSALDAALRAKLDRGFASLSADEPSSAEADEE